jgi:DNA-binding NtrC family response regulator
MASVRISPRTMGDWDAPSDTADQKVVLVVEDERDIRDLLEETLLEAGLYVLSAPNALSAFEIIQSAVRIDALLTDVCMPGAADGRELARFVLNTRPEIKIAFLAGSPLSPMDPIAKYVRFVMKPARMSEVANLLRSMLEDNDETPTMPYFGALEPMGRARTADRPPSSGPV